MLILIYAILLLASLAFLAKTSQIAVDSALKFSRIVRISELAIGFVFVSILTTLPELSVSLSAIIRRNAEISIGNLLGSNVANLGLILGTLSILVPISAGKRIWKKLLNILFFATIIPFFLLALAEVSFFVGIPLLLIFFLVSFYTAKEKIVFEIKPIKGNFAEIKFLKPLTILCLALFGVIISASIVVTSASHLAEYLKIAHSFIGATIVAVGTSLPEFSFCLAAVKKRRFGLALGDLIGACLTNLTFVLGIVLLFSPMVMNFQIFSTILFFVVGTTIVTWYFISTGMKLKREEGVFLALIYIAYLIILSGIEFGF